MLGKRRGGMRERQFRMRRLPVSLSLLSSFVHAPRITSALARACFTSAHKCALLGVPLLLPSAYEGLRPRRRRGDLRIATRYAAGRNAFRIRKARTSGSPGFAGKCRRVFRNFEEPSIPQTHEDTCPEGLGLANLTFRRKEGKSRNSSFSFFLSRIYKKKQ